MKQLRRAGVCQNDLLYYYQAAVRTVLEYASPCWQTSLTKEQTKQLEDVQRRALQIIFGNCHGRVQTCRPMGACIACLVCGGVCGRC